jgi:hypothetical protein
MKDKITIQELNERKEKLRESIKELVDGFAEETGTRPKIEIGLSTVAKIFGSASYAVNILIRV